MEKEEVTRPDIEANRLIRVVLESPFAGKTAVLRVRNLAYARMCLRHSLLCNEAPLASHLLYTQPGVLEDRVVEEHIQGMWAGWSWIPYAERLVVYMDFGISEGMQRGIYCAQELKVPVIYRKLRECAASPAEFDDTIKSRIEATLQEVST
jgi:hypothetical protein